MELRRRDQKNGVGRSYDEGGHRTNPRWEAVNSLFFYSLPLISPENVFLKLQAVDHMHARQPGALEQTLKRSLRTLLQLEESFELELKPPKGLSVIAWTRSGHD